MENKNSPQSHHRVDHLANERTFLAWIRTSLGIMAFGFVVEKFALFIKQIAFFFTKEGVPLPANASLPSQGHSPLFGILLVGLGALIGLCSYLQFIKNEKQIEQEVYVRSNILSVAVTILVMAMGVFLLIYLMMT